MDTHPDAPAGFCLVVYGSAEKSFALRYRDHQRASRQIVIGSPRNWSVQAARARAAALLVEIDGGRNPLAERYALRYRDHQRASRQIVIGSPRNWSVQAARARAAALLVEIDGGRNPLAERYALRQRAQSLALEFIRDRQANRRTAAQKKRRPPRVRMFDALDELRRQQSEATA
jgi:hypothetical protein